MNCANEGYCYPDGCRCMSYKYPLQLMSVLKKNKVVNQDNEKSNSKHLLLKRVILDLYRTDVVPPHFTQKQLKTIIGLLFSRFI